MDKIYFFVTNCSTWQDQDPNQYLSNYFIDGSGFLNSFLIALIVAVIFAAVFYGWIGMAVERLSNLGVWLGGLVLDGIVAFIATKLLVIGSQSAQNGIFSSIAEHQSQLSSQIPVADQAGHQQLTNTTQQLIDTLSNNGDVVISLLIGTAVISIILYFLISICVKGLTTHATHVPF